MMMANKKEDLVRVGVTTEVAFKEEQDMIDTAQTTEDDHDDC